MSEPGRDGRRRDWGLAVLVVLGALGGGKPAGVAAPPLPPVDVIYDTDMALDVDDVGALALLHALADRSECRILAVGVSESARAYDGQWAAPLADALNTYYGRPDIPIGIYGGPHQAQDERGRYAEKTATAFPHRLRSGADAPEAYRLYRQILAARPDRSVTMISVGFLTNLEALLRSGPDEKSPLDGIELVRRKVKQWSCMGGRFPTSGEQGEFNLATYPEATAYVLARWPTPTVFSGFEVGARIKTGARLIRERDPAKSPVARAYLEYTGGKDRESWDQTAALFAVRGLAHGGETYFSTVTDGHNRFEVTTDPFVGGGKPARSRNTWMAEPDSDQAYLVTAMPVERLAQTIEALMMQEPAAARAAYSMVPLTTRQALLMFPPTLSSKRRSPNADAYLGRRAAATRGRASASEAPSP